MAEIVPLTDAVAELVRDGDSVALEGFTHLIPFAAGHEIMRQGRRELELIRMTPDVLYDQLIGMGAARRLVFSYGGNPGGAAAGRRDRPRAGGRPPGQRPALGIPGVQKEAVLAARLVTVERIVDELRPRPGGVVLPAWVLDAVVEAPGGSRPSYSLGVTEPTTPSTARGSPSAATATPSVPGWRSTSCSPRARRARPARTTSRRWSPRGG